MLMTGRRNAATLLHLRSWLARNRPRMPSRGVRNCRLSLRRPGFHESVARKPGPRCRRAFAVNWIVDTARWRRTLTHCALVRILRGERLLAGTVIGNNGRFTRNAGTWPLVDRRSALRKKAVNSLTAPAPPERVICDSTIESRRSIDLGLLSAACKRKIDTGETEGENARTSMMRRAPEQAVM